MTTARSSRRSSRAVLALLAVAVIAGGVRVSAHRLDEFLQAARIAIEPDRVVLEMSLTPGTAVADGVIHAIDTDANGVFSVGEKQAYAAGALSALVLRVDGGPQLHMTIAGSTVPEAAAMRAGDGVIAIRAEARLQALSAGSHRLLFRNEHAPAGSVYLANALVPDTDQIVVTGQDRDGDQRELTIHFAANVAPAASTVWVWPGLMALVLAVLLLFHAHPRHADVPRHA